MLCEGRIREYIMQDLLKDYLVEHMQGDKRQFSLTCSVCGSHWKSAVFSITEDGAKGIPMKLMAVEEAGKHNRMCTFCGRPICLRCFEDVEGIFLCSHCAQDLRRRLDMK